MTRAAWLTLAASVAVAAVVVGGWFALTNAIDAHHREPSTHTPISVAWLPEDTCVPQPAPPTLGCGPDDMPILLCDGMIRCMEAWTS